MAEAVAAEERKAWIQRDAKYANTVQSAEQAVDTDTSCSRERSRCSLDGRQDTQEQELELQWQATAKHKLLASRVRMESGGFHTASIAEAQWHELQKSVAEKTHSDADKRADTVLSACCTSAGLTAAQEDLLGAGGRADPAAVYFKAQNSTQCKGLLI